MGEHRPSNPKLLRSLSTGSGSVTMSRIRRAWANRLESLVRPSYYCNLNGPLRGVLRETVFGATNLINLNYSKYKGTASNPYVTILVYPEEPAAGDTPVPSVWRSPTV